MTDRAAATILLLLASLLLVAILSAVLTFICVVRGLPL